MLRYPTEEDLIRACTNCGLELYIPTSRVSTVSSSPSKLEGLNAGELNWTMPLSQEETRKLWSCRPQIKDQTFYF